MRNLSRLFISCFFSLFASVFAQAKELTIPIALDYGIVHQALSRQLFTGQDQTVLLFDDGFNCNSLILSEPQVNSAENGLISVQTRISAKIGTPLGGNCLMPITWQGNVQTLQQVFVAPDGKTLGFRVMDSNIITTPENAEPAPSVLWDWIKSYIHPQLSAVTIDLGPAVTSLQQLLGASLQGSVDPMAMTALSSLALKDVSPQPDKMHIAISLNAPDMPANWLPESTETLSEDELARWDAAWQAWDGFATWLIKTMAAPADPELAAALGEILLEARYDLYQALSSDDKSRDPVRELFTKTWERLAPLVRDNRLSIPGVEALQLATFISAADALQALDTAAPHLGMRFDSQTFRSLARLMLPAVSDAELGYNTEVDPALRALLGFDPEFNDTGVEDGEGLEFLDPFAFLVPSARAAAVDPKLVKKLTGWVPASDELDEYLKAVNQLLDEVIAAEREKGKVPVAFFPVYESLVLATAWQESCWRQFVDKGGKVQPILSSAGSVGMMQVNKAVWRGIYDPALLHDNIAYNARAGNEILVHYLVDYAIKKKEHEITGKPDSLAQATYAIYNGGPRHISRYRNPQTSKHLKYIDREFWEKYQAIRRKGASEVKACYGA